MKNLNTTISGAVAAVSSILSFIASAPPELQNQIPQLFPEHSRGTIALYLRFVATFATFYLAYSAADKKQPPTPPAPVVPPVTK